MFVFEGEFLCFSATVDPRSNFSILPDSTRVDKYNPNKICYDRSPVASLLPRIVYYGKGKNIISYFERCPTFSNRKWSLAAMNLVSSGILLYKVSLRFGELRDRSEFFLYIFLIFL